jgi:Flp pilus assembly protein TadG
MMRSCSCALRTFLARLRAGPLADERGGTTTFVLLLVVPMVMMAGLAFDGGQILSARREAADTAQQAALAGAQAIDGPTVRQGQIEVSPGLVQAAATQYLAEAGHTGTVQVTATEITVTVTQTVDMQLLSVIGVGSKTVTGVATSRLIRGVDSPEN